MRLRVATECDAEGVAHVYAPYVRESAISFELDSPTESEMRRRIVETLEKFPWLVAEEGDRIVGYAYASSYRSRCAYSWSVESAVYVDREHHRKGVGRQLYAYLIERLQKQGVINVIAGIALPNEASVRLHESLGFKPVARFKEVGFKLGCWWDVGFWQLQLTKPEVPRELRAPQYD